MEELLTLSFRYKYSFSDDGKLYLYEYNYETNYFERMFSFESIENYQILLKFSGYKRLTIDDFEDEISDIPERYHISIVYYVRAKAYLEKGDIEKHNYYLSLFEKELKDKRKNTTPLTSIPSEYSLL